MLRLADIRRNAARRPDGTAIVDGPTRLTWREFEDRTGRVAAGLHALLPPERPARAAFVAGNSWQLVVLMAACASLGVPCVGLDHTASPEATAHALAQLRPTVLISTAACRPLLERAGVPDGGDGVLAVHLDGSTEGAPTYASLAAAEPREVEPVGQPFATYCFTSGTSGRPKMVIRTFSFEERRLATLVRQFGFGPDDVHLVTVPLYHSSGPGWARVFLARGGRIVLCPEGDGADLARLIRAEGVSTTLMVPPVLASLVSHPDSRELAATSRLRFVLSGGRQLNRWLIATAWERLGPVLHLYYGTTETGVNTLITPDELHTARAARGAPGRAAPSRWSTRRDTCSRRAYAAGSPSRATSSWTTTPPSCRSSWTSTLATAKAPGASCSRATAASSTNRGTSNSPAVRTASPRWTRPPRWT